MFEGRDILLQDVEQLNSDDKVILMSLLKRKFDVEIDYKWTDKEIIDKINRERVNAKTKRLEENYKLVFKRALKYL